MVYYYASINFQQYFDHYAGWGTTSHSLLTFYILVFCYTFRSETIKTFVTQPVIIFRNVIHGIALKSIKKSSIYSSVKSDLSSIVYSIPCAHAPVFCHDSVVKWSTGSLCAAMFLIYNSAVSSLWWSVKQWDCSANRNNLVVYFV